jgi:hypothetical protein
LTHLKTGTPEGDNTVTLVPINELYDVRMVRVGLDTPSGLPLLCAAQKNHIKYVK